MGFLKRLFSRKKPEEQESTLKLLRESRSPANKVETTSMGRLPIETTAEYAGDEVVPTQKETIEEIQIKIATEERRLAEQVTATQEKSNEELRHLFNIIGAEVRNVDAQLPTARAKYDNDVTTIKNEIPLREKALLAERAANAWDEGDPGYEANQKKLTRLNVIKEQLKSAKDCNLATIKTDLEIKPNTGDSAAELKFLEQRQKDLEKITTELNSSIAGKSDVNSLKMNLGRLIDLQQHNIKLTNYPNELKGLKAKQTQLEKTKKELKKVSQNPEKNSLNKIKRDLNMTVDAKSASSTTRSNTLPLQNRTTTTSTSKTKLDVKIINDDEVARGKLLSNDQDFTLHTRKNEKKEPIGNEISLRGNALSDANRQLSCLEIIRKILSKPTSSFHQNIYLSGTKDSVDATLRAIFTFDEKYKGKIHISGLNDTQVEERKKAIQKQLENPTTKKTMEDRLKVVEEKYEEAQQSSRSQTP